ncbi:MAG: ABC transporter substrate-binding protein [Colwellia sp.]|nr:ABC transporter substrate-binding protein [Colwellia sp.]
MNKWFVSIILCFSSSFYVIAQPEIRIGVLKYGTVNWEIDVIKHHQLDKKYNFNLQVMPLSNKNASAVALQSKAVDIILGDWLWVNRQRFDGKNYTLVPTSIASGGLYVNGDSTAKSLHDLKQTKIGIAGGAVDKNWLLLQAYAQKKHQLNIKEEAEIVFATPPLLNRLIQRNDVDAAINFWHYNARLNANGYRLLVSVPQMLAELGITNKVPLLGWVFEQEWAIKNNQKLTGFLQASNEAKQLLLLCDDEWQRIRPLTKAENDKVFLALKNEYRTRLLHKFGAEEMEASKQVFAILSEQGGRNLVGKATTLAEGTFWQTAKINLPNSDQLAKDKTNHQVACPIK